MGRPMDKASVICVCRCEWRLSIDVAEHGSRVGLGTYEEPRDEPNDPGVGV